jgi:hypothetical protein
VAVNILGAGLSRKYRNSDFPYVQMQNLIETNSAGKDKWRLPSPMYEIEGYPWLPSSLNFEKAFHESESRNEMLHSAPSYPTISFKFRNLFQ